MSKARVIPQRASLIVVLLGSMLAACSGSERAETSTWSAVFDTIGDTIVVRSKGSVWGDTAQLVEDLRIGVLEGADEYMFGDIQSLAVGADGAIYTYDSHLKVLRKHSATGEFIATLGREGEGPGEYNRPDAGLVALADGRILLRDPGNARISVYSADGEYLDGLRIRGGWMSSRPLFHDTAGNVYQWITLNPEDDFSDWSTGLVRYGPDGIAGDTLEVPDYDFEPPQVEARSDGERRSFASTPVPFSPDITWAYSPLGYFAVGLSERYAIDLFVTPDQVLRIERGDWAPIPVLPEEHAEQERRITAMMQGIQPGWRWNGPPIPDTKPPYEEFFVGTDGRIWVQLYQEAYKNVAVEEEAEEIRPGYAPPAVWEEPVAFDVFEPHGTYLGMVRAPEGLRMHPTPVARGDTIWAVVVDDMDVEYIARYHVRHGAEPPATD
jgi:hypothetical protein